MGKWMSQRDFRTKNLLERVSNLVEGGFMPKPKWFDAMRLHPPVPPLIGPEPPLLDTPEVPLLRKLLEKHPALKLQKTEFLSTNRTIAQRFALAQARYMKKGSNEDQAYLLCMRDFEKEIHEFEQGLADSIISPEINPDKYNDAVREALELRTMRRIRGSRRKTPKLTQQWEEHLAKKDGLPSPYSWRPESLNALRRRAEGDPASITGRAMELVYQARWQGTPDVAAFESQNELIDIIDSLTLEARERALLDTYLQQFEYMSAREQLELRVMLNRIVKAHVRLRLFQNGALPTPDTKQKLIESVHKDMQAAERSVNESLEANDSQALQADQHEVKVIEQGLKDLQEEAAAVPLSEKLQAVLKEEEADFAKMKQEFAQSEQELRKSLLDAGLGKHAADARLSSLPTVLDVVHARHQIIQQQIRDADAKLRVLTAQSTPGESSAVRVLRDLKSELQTRLQYVEEQLRQEMRVVGTPREGLTSNDETLATLKQEYDGAKRSMWLNLAHIVANKPVPHTPDNVIGYDHNGDPVYIGDRRTYNVSATARPSITAAPEHQEERKAEGLSAAELARLPQVPSSARHIASDWGIMLNDIRNGEAVTKGLTVEQMANTPLRINFNAFDQNLPDVRDDIAFNLMGTTLADARTIVFKTLRAAGIEKRDARARLAKIMNLREASTSASPRKEAREHAATMLAVKDYFDAMPDGELVSVMEQEARTNGDTQVADMIAAAGKPEPEDSCTVQDVRQALASLSRIVSHAAARGKPRKFARPNTEHLGFITHYDVIEAPEFVQQLGESQNLSALDAFVHTVAQAPEFDSVRLPLPELTGDQRQDTATMNKFGEQLAANPELSKYIDKDLKAALEAARTGQPNKLVDEIHTFVAAELDKSEAAQMPTAEDKHEALFDAIEAECKRHDALKAQRPQHNVDPVSFLEERMDAFLQMQELSSAGFMTKDERTLQQRALSSRDGLREREDQGPTVQRRLTSAEALLVSKRLRAQLQPVPADVATLRKAKARQRQKAAQAAARASS